MGWTPADSLVIGISSRALFRLDDEDCIYRAAGTQAFIDYQRQHEDDAIPKDVAFQLIESLLALNHTLGNPDKKPAIEIVILSKNHPDCAIRIKRALEHHKMDIRRAVFTGGENTLPYLRAFEVDLFLSKEEDAVKEAIQNGIPAGLIYGGPDNPEELGGTPIMAFDGDAVLFSDEADRVYKQEKLPGFDAFEREHLKVPLPPGPLHKFALALEEVRQGHPIDSPPFRIALVTARDLKYCERPMRTLREFGIRVDHAAFCGDMSKRIVLEKLRPLIFFDDTKRNCDDACISTPTAIIPAIEQKIATTVSSSPAWPATFMGICKIVLRKNYTEAEPLVTKWYGENLSSLKDEALASFMVEFERSANGTPTGRQRRASAANNTDLAKLLQFLEQLKLKHG